MICFNCDCFVVLEQVQDQNFVLSLVEPYPWAVESLLGSDVPVSTKIMAVDPNVALMELAHVNISIIGFIELSFYIIQTRSPLTFLVIGPCRFSLQIEFEVIVNRALTGVVWFRLCLVLGYLFFTQLKNTLLVEKHLFSVPAEVHMTHGLNQNSYLALWCFTVKTQVLNLLRWFFVLVTIKGRLVYVIYVQKRDIMEQNLIHVTFWTFYSKFIHNHTLVVHLQNV